MWGSIRQLDRLLRGEATSLAELRREQLEFPVLGLSAVIATLGIIYGACMGIFAITGSGSGAAMQVPASMLKVPALFFLTLIVTCPSLYVFNALVGSRLTFLPLMRLLIGSLAVMLAVLASLGPIVAFFSISTTSYSFILLLNVLVFALSGLLGLVFLLQTLHRMTIARRAMEPPPPPAIITTDPDVPPDAQKEDFGALDRLDGQVLGPHVRTIFRIWVILFGVVGAQMSWVLRPFVGNPDRPFQWFRSRESNFFQAIWDLLRGFFG